MTLVPPNSGKLCFEALIVEPDAKQTLFPWGPPNYDPSKGGPWCLEIKALSREHGARALAQTKGTGNWTETKSQLPVTKVHNYRCLIWKPQTCYFCKWHTAAIVVTWQQVSAISFVPLLSDSQFESQKEYESFESTFTMCFTLHSTSETKAICPRSHHPRQSWIYT